MSGSLDLDLDVAEKGDTISKLLDGGFDRFHAIHTCFEEVAVAVPGAVALTDGDTSLTYLQLDRRANGIAHRLIDRGVLPGSLVGLHTGNGIETVCGILGILKAGCAYLPLDPVYPADRVKFMLDDAGVAAVVAQDCLRAALGELSVPTIATDVNAQADVAPLLPVSRNNLAYVIYTSGSSGRPKGVRISHGNVLRLFGRTRHWFEFGPADVWSLFHSYAFDFSVWEIFGALLHGGRLVNVPQSVRRSPLEFRELLIREGVTVLNQTPSAFCQLVSADLNCPPECFALRYIVFGGEALQFENLRPWFERYGDDRPAIINMYGITETTVHVTYRRVRAADLNEASSLIGEPIADLTLHVLDPEMNPVPAGVEGEIYVGGAGLAQGYLNRPELTAERFIPDPFSRVAGARLYRTGDLALRREDGELEYRGRIDQQVKISGYRIELGEIEAAILADPAIRNAVAMARDDLPVGRAIVAYLTAGQNSDGIIDRLRASLRSRLPEYMVPAYFVVVDHLPLNHNGKIDRAALPLPVCEAAMPRSVTTATATERTIAGIWESKLGLANIDLDESFFDLGGKSLQLTQVHAELRKQTGIHIEIADMFAFPTIRSLAAYLDGATGFRQGGGESLRKSADARARMQRSAIERRQLKSGRAR